MKAWGERITAGALDPAPDGDARPEHRGDLMRRVAGLDLVGDDRGGAAARGRRAVPRAAC